MRPAQAWIVTLEHQDNGEVFGLLTVCGSTTRGEVESYGFSGLSSAIFPELLTVLDATIFTYLGIADGVLSEGQLPLV